MFRYLLAIALLPSMLSAQRPEHQMPQRTTRKPMAMMMIDPLGISMERMGSGTTWIPDAVALPDPPPRQAGRKAVGRVRELGIRE